MRCTHCGRLTEPKERDEHGHCLACQNEDLREQVTSLQGDVASLQKLLTLSSRLRQTYFVHLNAVTSERDALRFSARQEVAHAL